MKTKPYKPLLRSLDSYIPAVNTARFLQGKKRILIVGDAGGRDWEYLRSVGKDVHVLDIAPQTQIPNLCIQSIEKRTPFKDGFFDGVVMNEVIEHLFHDVVALEEVHRILSDDGVLVVTVPYFSNVQDHPEYHVRVHTPRTIRRLLEKCGFTIEEHFCRGFCSRLPQLGFVPRAAIYGLQYMVTLLLRSPPDLAVSRVNGVFDKIERKLGSHQLTCRLQRLFASYGGVMKARKHPFRKDFDAIQISSFENRSA